MIDRDYFFKQIKALKLFTSFTQLQVDGINAILDEWELWVNSKWVDNDLRKLAYIFATDYHETGTKMYPVEEIGKGKNRPYGIPDKRTGKTYYGRGDVQLTWYDNYLKMGKLLKYDLINHPELALDNKISKEIMFEGMLTGSSFRGDFTGKSLNNYFNTKTDDPINARRIINGTDKAQLIASYHNKFLISLKNIS